MGMSWAEHSVEIAAPVETSFDAIVDYESFPGWQDAVDSVEVLSRTPDGLGERVRLFVDAKVRKIDYTLHYSYERPTQIEWDFVEGNGMRDVDGVFTLESLGPDRSRATYKLGADPEIPVPGMVLRRTHKALVKRSVEDLKREAERRFAEAGPAEQPDGGSEPDGESEPRPKRRFGRRRKSAERAPAAPEGGAADPSSATARAEGWRPKAEREPPAAPSRDASRRDSLTAIPTALIGRGLSAAADAARMGREAAEGAAKAGFDVAQDAAARIDRHLTRGGDPGEDPGDERDRS